MKMKIIAISLMGLLMAPLGAMDKGNKTTNSTKEIVGKLKAIGLEEIVPMTEVALVTALGVWAVMKLEASSLYPKSYYAQWAVSLGASGVLGVLMELILKKNGAVDSKNYSVFEFWRRIAVPCVTAESLMRSPQNVVRYNMYTAAAFGALHIIKKYYCAKK